MSTDTVLDILRRNCLSVRGAVRLPPDATHPNWRRVIIQGASEHNANAHDLLGRPVQIWEYHQPIDPKTARQLAQRARLIAANNQYKAMTPAARETYRDEANRRKLNLYQTIISALMRGTARPMASR